MGFLTEQCQLSAYNERTLQNCQPFTCGKDNDMDEFFRTDVFSYSKFLMSKAYCFRLKEDLTQIVCIFTLSNDSIRIYDLPNSTKNKMWSITHHKKMLKRYPGVLIGRLAVSEKYSRKGIGSELLRFIGKMFLDPNNKTGCRFIVVDAKNEPEVLRFYEKNHFSLLFKQEMQEDFYTKQPKDNEEKLLRTNMPRKLATRLLFKDLLAMES